MVWLSQLGLANGMILGAFYEFGLSGDGAMSSGSR